MSLLKFVLNKNCELTSESTSTAGSSATRGKSLTKYRKFSNSERYEIGKFAAEFGNKWAVQRYNIVESTVRSFKKKYVEKVKDHCKEVLGVQEESSVAVLNKEIACAKRGRKTLLGDKIDEKLKAYVEKLRKGGACVNSPVVMAAAIGIVKKEQPSLLPHIKLTRDWAWYQLKRWGYSKRKATKVARKLPPDFSSVKAKFLRDISSEVSKYSIPESMILNWDQTAVSMVPTSHWTMNRTGGKQVTMVGLNDKRQITILLAVAADGTLLPPQVSILSGNVTSSRLY